MRAYRWQVSGDAIYRQHADLYARLCEHSLPNAAYDRPAILRLAGDVAGRRVLELGCAGGVLTQQRRTAALSCWLWTGSCGWLPWPASGWRGAPVSRSLTWNSRWAWRLTLAGGQLSGKADYHRTELVSEQWDWDGQPVTAQMYRRPISAIFSQLRGAGFTVDTVDEPQPEAAADTGNPEVMQILRTQPVFLFIRALRARSRPMSDSG